MKKELISQFNQTPSLIAPQFVESLNAFDSKEQPTKENLSSQALSIFTGVASGDYKPYAFSEGIAIIQVQGTLIHKLGWSSRSVTGYDVIRRKLEFARNDPQTLGILMRFHSPGGSAFGCPDTGDLIADIAKEKPVWTLAEDMAFSAAQWLHSQGSRRLVTQSASLGSIGVVMAHADLSKAYQDAGIKITLMHAGERKVDGNPYEALPKDVQDELEVSCEKTRQQFAAAVSKGTGISVKKILATEAATYSAQDAVKFGLADEVVSGNNILQEFISEVKTTKLNMGKLMSTKKNQGLSTDQTTEENLEKKEMSPAAERSRIKSIMTSTSAKGHEKLANYLAFETDMAAEEAEKILAVSTPSSKEEGSNSDSFFKAMNHEEHPNLSADNEDDETDQNSPDAKASAILADFSAVTGLK